MSERSYISRPETPQQTVKFLETLLRASTDGIVITDATQSVVLVNEAFCGFLGRRPPDVIETSLFVWLEQLQPDAPRRWAELERRVHHEGACRDVDFEITTRDGRRHLNVNASPLERVGDEERGASSASSATSPPASGQKRNRGNTVTT
jgi:PAS domain S-box-containing protein